MITIAWDVDDILNDLMYNWLTKKWLLEFPDCRVNFEQITENTPESIINISKEEYLLSLDNFRLSKNYSQMKPNAEILAWFENFGDKARHMALTAVPVLAAHVSAEWVMRHFGKWIRSFNFVPSLRKEDENTPAYDKSKVDYLKRMNRIDLLVEDSEINIREAEESGIKGMLIGKPWNKSNLSVADALLQINRLL
jgi:hypothetical protein